MESNIQTAKFGAGASRIFTSNARYIVAVAGQRGGKTTTGAYWAYSQATRMRTEETTKGKVAVPPSGIICAPTYDLLRHSTLNRFFEEFPSLQRYYKEYQREMNIPIAKVNGKPVYSKIFTRSLEDPQMLRGLLSWWFWADEGDVAPEEAWEFLKGRISDKPDGQGLITSTLAPDSWINRLIYQPMLAGRLEGIDIVTWPSNDRPGFPQSEWERIKAETDPIKFARDYEGKFSFESGLIYGDILSYGVIDEVPEGVEMLATFYGLDYGLNHPTVVLLVGYGSDGVWYILNEHVESNMSVDQINEVIKGNMMIYSGEYGAPWATYYDPAGGIAALSIDPDCFPAVADKDVDGRITLVRNFIYQKRVKILSHCRSTIREVSLYSYEGGKTSPKKENDDCMDAMGYVIYNAWASVDGLKKKDNEVQKSRIMQYEEARGLIKDGVFQTQVNQQDFLM